MLDLYKVNADKTISQCPEVIETSTSKITNPSEAVANRFGYWPKEEVPEPTPEEGYVFKPDGYAYVDVEDGKKVVNVWHKLKIVDIKPDIPEGWTIVDDYWKEDGDNYVHEYKILENVDVPPELQPGQQIVADHWETRLVDDVEKYVHVYEVRFVVDNPPELQPGQFIYEDHWDDDGTTKTHVYDVWTEVNERPDEQEGYRVCEIDVVDDAEHKVRTHIYKLKQIIDVKPEDDPDGNFWWEFDHEEEDEETITFIYRQVFRQWRIFSKLKLEYVAFQMGMLDKLDEFIDSLELTNEHGQSIKLRRLYDQANELGEKHPLFRPYYKQALEVFGWSEEQGEAFLQQIVQEPTPTEAQ